MKDPLQSRTFQNLEVLTAFGRAKSTFHHWRKHGLNVKNPMTFDDVLLFAAWCEVSNLGLDPGENRPFAYDILDALKDAVAQRGNSNAREHCFTVGELHGPTDREGAWVNPVNRVLARREIAAVLSAGEEKKLGAPSSFIVVDAFRLWKRLESDLSLSGKAGAK